MEYVADLHLHSKYSRAVSQNMILPTMAEWAKKKGIDILTTGDFTHPLWFQEIRGQLEEAGEGIFKVKSQKLEGKNTDEKSKIEKEPVFLLTVEVSSIYSQGGKLRRMHNLIFAPSFETAEKINKELQRRGVNLLSDGRPMMGVSSINLIELVLGIDKRALLIPCHIWTPWFSLYGSNSGFDSIEECFGDYSKYIYAVETGLSSDPAMNWKIKDLENRSILSFSDAHSPAKMGREATVFKLKEMSYENVRKAIIGELALAGPAASLPPPDVLGRRRSLRALGGGPPLASPATGFSRHNYIAYTIEFYPEEGKYHYTGHRNCKVVQSPEETAKNGRTCPVCKRTLTVGVEHRVRELARNYESGIMNQESKDDNGVTWIKDKERKRPAYVSLVPLLEIMAEALSSTTSSQRVKDLFDQLTASLGSELDILLRKPVSEIEKRAGSRVADGVRKVRGRDIVVIPGYDGVYGTVEIWPSKALAFEGKGDDAQLGLF